MQLIVAYEIVRDTITLCMINICKKKSGGSAIAQFAYHVMPLEFGLNRKIRQENQILLKMF